MLFTYELLKIYNNILDNILKLKKILYKIPLTYFIYLLF